MCRTRRLLVTLALCTVVIAFAARVVRADDWLPVAPEDLALKDNPASPGADAMVLYRDSLVSAKDVGTGGDSDEEYIRIKIFTQAGVKRGDVQIEFFKSQNDVKDVRGRTIHPDGSIVNFSGKVLEKEVVKLSGGRVLAKTFSLPDVQPGSIIEYRYTLQGNPQYLHDEQWVVSSALFTREAHFTFIPYQGYTGFVPMVRTLGLPPEATPQCGIDGKCAMVARNIPPVVEEPLMPPVKLLEARVEFHYQSTNEAHGENTAAYWNRITRKLNGELEHFIDKKGPLNAQIGQIVGPGDSPEEKLRKIYARVLKIRNLSFEDERTDKENREEEIKKIANVEDVLTNGYGTGIDIDRLYIGLVRAAGFDASELWVATRNDHIFSPESHDERELNADLVWVSAGGKEYYLDPGAKYYAFGQLPWYETNDMGFKLTKKGPESVTTPLPISTDAVIARQADLAMNDAGEISGTVRIDFQGQEGAVRREENRDEDAIGQKKQLEDEIKSWLPVNATLDITSVANWGDVEQPLRVEATLKTEGFAGSVGRRVIVPAEIFRAPQLGFFQAERRVNAVYIHYPYEEIDDLKLHVPDSFKIANLPNLPKIDKGPVTYELTATTQGNTSEVKRHLVIKGMVFPKETYLALRSFFNSVKTDDDAQIMLQSAESAKN